MKEILQEAIQKFPIGAVVLSVGQNIMTIRDIPYISGQNIWNAGGIGELYNGEKQQWAEVLFLLKENYQIY